MKFGNIVKSAKDKIKKHAAERMKQRSYLPPYKLNMFNSCALKYKLKFISQIPVEYKPSPHLSFNKTFKNFINEWLMGFIKLSAPLESLQEVLKKHWDSKGYSDADEEKKFWNNACKGIEKLKENASSFPETPTDVNWKFRVQTERTSSGGSVDRVDMLENGEVLLTSFKTGSRTGNEESVRADTHANLFAWAGCEKWPGKVIRVRFYYLVAGEIVDVVFTDDDITAFREKLDKTTEKINNKEFEENMGPLCSTCEYLRACPAWPVKPYEIANETPAVFKKRLRLSYSKMSLYTNCPFVYNKGYNEKIRSKPRPFFSFGTTIHETFEEVYGAGELKSIPSLETIYSIFDKKFNANLVGYSTETEKEKYYQDGRRHIEMYYNHFMKDQNLSGIKYMIERYFEIPIGKNSVMIGFIDRIDNYPDGTCGIMDYKTEPTLRSQEAVDRDMQLTIYYWAAKQSMQLNPVQLSLYMLDFDKIITTTRTEEDLPQLIEYVENVTEQILNDTSFGPRINKYCKSCDYLEICPKREEILTNDSLKSMQKF